MAQSKKSKKLTSILCVIFACCEIQHGPHFLIKQKKAYEQNKNLSVKMY